MSLRELRDAIHANAVAKGWWPSDRSWREIRILVVSEVSEALEEFRAGRMHVWFEPFGAPPDHEAALRAATAGVKPEGFPVELADAAIRLLDYAGRMGWQYDDEDEVIVVGGLIDGTNKGVPDQLDKLTEYLYEEGTFPIETIVWRALASCFDVTRRNGIDLLAAIQLKHAYNKTRPFRHGGKAA